MPVNLLCVTVAVNFVLSLIYLGSASALLVLLGSATLLYAVCYMPIFQGSPPTSALVEDIWATPAISDCLEQ